MARVRVVKPQAPDPAQIARIVVTVVGVIVVLFVVQSTWYKVEPDEVGVVTRFGRYVRTEEPGLHFKLPWGLEAVQLVQARKVHKLEFGFRTAEAGIRTRYDQRAQPEVTRMLTGDLNAAEVEWIVQYRISDPTDYLFKVRSPDDTLSNLSESVMRAVVGDRSVFEVLTEGRTEINEQVRLKLQAVVDDYEMGIRVQLVQLQNVDPPDQVRDSFNDVNQAEQERQRTINEAEQEYNRTIPLARGQAQKTVQEAEGFKIDRINRARGETARFLSLLGEFEKAPEVTERRLYLETMQRVLPQLGRTVVVDDTLKGTLPLLHLTPERGVDR